MVYKNSEKIVGYYARGIANGCWVEQHFPDQMKANRAGQQKTSNLFFLVCVQLISMLYCGRRRDVFIRYIFLFTFRVTN